MNVWIPYALGAALLYGMHQIFTKLAADRIGEGLGGLVVEVTAAATIGLYVIYMWTAGREQPWSVSGAGYSVLTGLCVGGGTILFFLLFQQRGPLSAVPAVLAGGAALMAVVGIAAFHEPASASRLTGIALALAGLFLLTR